MAFLSIIIAAHNAKDTLHTTLESLQNAIEGAWDDVEIIIFNDSSNDSTQDIIEAWLPMLPNAQSRYVEYRNVGHVRNSALSLASGESREWTRAYSFSLHDAGSGSRSFR